MSEMSRRDFAESLALAALAPMLAPALGPVRWPSAAAPVISPAGLSGHEPGALAKALAAAIRAQYGDRLSEADFAVVTRQIENGLERAEKLRSVVLPDGAEPAFVFSPFRSDGAG
jgi:hypothetical protein